MVLGNRNYGFGKSIKFHGGKFSKISWEKYLSHEIKSIYFHNVNPTWDLISVKFHIGGGGAAGGGGGAGFAGVEESLPPHQRK